MKLHRFSQFTVFSVFLLLIVGATVNPTGSSLACPDWPTCYGSFFPEMKGGILFEHSHRVVATLVGFLTIVQAIWITAARHDDPLLAKLGWTAVFLVVFQGVLGGVTVLMGLSWWVSTTHLAIAMAFFCYMIYLSYRLRPGRGAPTLGPYTGRLDGPERLAVGMCALAVYLQIILGGLMRHTQSGRACLDFPWCNGEIWPGVPGGRIHMLHRYSGYAIFVLLLVVVFKYRKTISGLKRPGANFAFKAVPVVLTLQVALGVLTVFTYLRSVDAMGVSIVAAHLAVGAGLLALLAYLYLDLGRQLEHIRIGQEVEAVVTAAETNSIP
ncbi:MAG: Heme A synthase [Myxococcota bacterium]|nr:Heme A synthase [Myxococcota bacterium]